MAANGVEDERPPQPEKRPAEIRAADDIPPRVVLTNGGTPPRFHGGGGQTPPRAFGGMGSQTPPRAFGSQTPPRVARKKDSDMGDSHRLLAQLAVPDSVEPIIREGTCADLDKYLEAVDKLQFSIAFFDRNRHLNSCEGALRHARQLLAQAMQSLQEDFYEMLGSSSNFVDPSELRDQLELQFEAEEARRDQYQDRGTGPRCVATDPQHLPELLFPDALPVLHSMAKRLVVNGNGDQCAKAYRDRRVAALLRNLTRLGLEKVTVADIEQIPWEQQDQKIRDWILHVQLGVRCLLAGERQICEKVLEGLEPFRERSFAELGSGGMQVLLSFGEAVAEKSKKAPENLFALLDMFSIVMDLLPRVEVMFDGPAGAPVRKSMAALLKGLAVSVKATLEEFELLVEQNERESHPTIPGADTQKRKQSRLARLISLKRHDELKDDAVSGAVKATSSSRASPADGGVHPLSSYVVNYVKLLTNRELPYVAALRLIYGDTARLDDHRKLTACLASLLLALTNNLQFKSKQLRDASVQELFLMNNVSYMVNNINSSDAGELLGATWIRRHRALVEEHQEGYIAAVRAKFNHLLADEKGGDTTGLNRRVQSFNQEFQDLGEKQARLVVMDPEHRAAIRQALQTQLGEAYRDFLKTHQ
eukprot:TRINITY_DN2491_c0_g1_i1.p1 TRINITY_DN2491_c0_g1~~TRINITY_DN2491_c0_g1_i1.p1  ORF type:complete len:647 (+),score=114.18 TRINITY_DN2491_c0_g1_i1:435-2375(+)